MPSARAAQTSDRLALAAMRFLPALFFAFAITTSGISACASSAGAGAQPPLPKSTLVIETALDEIALTVELADEPNEIQTGMMFRPSIGEDEGMLFDLGRTRVAFFWMRNTLIPLDIIFIDEAGRIINIAANAVPLSEETLVSQRPAGGVLEIRGGGAADFGIASGDLVRHAIFGNDN